MSKAELFKLENPPQIFRREIKPLRKDEYPSGQEIASLTGEVGKSKLEAVLRTMGMAAPVLIAPILAGCVPAPTETPVVRTSEEAGVTPSPFEIRTPTPTEIPTPTSEIIPSPTVTVEAVGFGMEELTPEEQDLAIKIEQDYREAAQKQEFEAGIIILTHGDEEGEVGAYFDDLEGRLWLLVTRGEEQVLESTLPYQEEAPVWNPDEMRFEAKDTAGKVIALWDPETSSWKEVIPPTPEPTATPTPEIQRVVYLEDNFAGTNRAVFEGPNPRFEGDALYFTFAEEGGSLLARARLPLSNFRLETRLSGNGTYGLTFGDFEGINYLLVLEKNGDLNLKKFLGEEYQSLRLSERVTSSSGTEGFHDFGIDYDGKKLALFFDGKEVGKVSEDLSESGRIGLFVWNKPEKDVWVGIDYLAVHLPQELIPTPSPVPLEPTETPRPPVCEIPHWPERTPDRKTGLIIAFGKPYQELYHPDTSPYAPYDNGARGMRMDIPGTDYNASKWVREAQIVSIDKENQIIKFYVGGGFNVQRRFTEETHVVMAAHEVYRGMPSPQARQCGGNFCDLEVGDIVGLVHLDKGGAVNLNPDVIALWGVLIVQ